MRMQLRLLHDSIQKNHCAIGSVNVNDKRLYPINKVS